MDSQELARATAHWLAYKRLSGFDPMFSEALLIIPIGEYFLGKGWNITAEKDCQAILGEGKRGYVNYDVFAEKKDQATRRPLEAVLLEMKFFKKGSSNHSRLITDFVKLAIPDTNRRFLRFSVLASEDRFSPPPWLEPFISGKRQLIKIVRSEESVKLNGVDEINLTKDGRDSIFSKLDAYSINSLAFSVEASGGDMSHFSDKVFVLTIEREGPAAGEAGVSS